MDRRPRNFRGFWDRMYPMWNERHGGWSKREVTVLAADWFDEWGEPDPLWEVDLDDPWWPLLEGDFTGKLTP